MMTASAFQVFEGGSVRAPRDFPCRTVPLHSRLLFFVEHPLVSELLEHLEAGIALAHARSHLLLF